MKAVHSDRPLHFIRAAQERTEILTSLLEWFDTERQKLLDSFTNAKGDQLLVLQGRVIQMESIRRLLGDMARAKDAA